MEKALEWFRSTGYSRWTLSYSDGDGKPFLFSPEGSGPESAHERLRSALEMFPSGKGFKIHATPSKDPADTKKGLYYQGKIDTPGAMGGVGGGWNPYMQPTSPAGLLDESRVAGMIREAVEKARLEDENKRLKEEVERLKGESPQTATDAAISTFVSGLHPYIPYILFGQNPPPAPVSGPRLERSEEETTKMVANSLERIARRCDALNVDLPAMLAKMADIAEKEPGKIQMLNSMIG